MLDVSTLATSGDQQLNQLASLTALNVWRRAVVVPQGSILN